MTLVTGKVKGKDPLFSPTAAQSIVQLHQCKALVQLRLRKPQLSVKITRVAVEDFKVTRHSTTVAHVRESRGILSRVRKQLLLSTEFLIFAISNKRIGHLSKCLLYRALVYKK